MKKYTDEFKQEVINYANQTTTNSASKKYSVSWDTVKRWVSPEYKKYRYKKSNESMKLRLSTDPIYKAKVYNRINNNINEKRKDLAYRKMLSDRATQHCKEKYKTDENYRLRQLQSARRRRARKKMVNEKYTIEDHKYTMNLFNNQCACCGSKDNLCVDHWRPLSKGHPLSRKNAVILCRSCNASKGFKFPEECYGGQFIKLIERTLNV